MAYDAFISYSHAGDDLLAARLQQALGRFAKPWWRRRSLRVFRDQTALAANPGLWSSITHALDESEWFVLLASPDAVESHWVNREVEYWCANKDPNRILSVLTDGEWTWDAEATDFSPASTAVPLALAGVFAEEPRHVDMRWARSETQLDLRNGRFRDQVAELAAPMHGLAKDEIEGEDVRAHRRTMRIAWAAVIALVVLLGASVAGAIGAVRAADEAKASEQAALDARTEADRQAELAVANAAEADRRKQDADASAAEADRQRNQADLSASEAERQRAEADRNAATAEAQRRAAEEANLQLAATNDQLAATNRELDQANEDLAATNSELDQTIAALDESNGQLDASNRDLATTNEQLASTNRQLSAANESLTAQAANLESGRLANLAEQTAGARLDVALALAAAAQQQAATDVRPAQRALFGLLEGRARGLERTLTYPTGEFGNAPIVAVGPDDGRIAVVLWIGVDQMQVSLWDGEAPSGAAPRVIDVLRGAPHEARFSPGERYLFVTTFLGSTQVDPEIPPTPERTGLEIIDLDSGAVVQSFDPAIGGRVVYSVDGAHAAVQSCVPVDEPSCERTIAMIDTRTATVLRERPGILPSSLGQGGAISEESRPSPDFSPDGSQLLAFAPPGEFQLWSFDNPASTLSLYTPSAGTFSVPTFDRSGDVVVGASQTGQVEVFDADTGLPQSVRSLGNDDEIRAIASLHGADVIAVLQPGRLVVLRGPATETFDVAGCATDVAASPQEEWFATGGTACHTSDLVEVTTGRHLDSLRGRPLLFGVDAGHEAIAYLFDEGVFLGDGNTFGVLDLTGGVWREVRRMPINFLRPEVDPATSTVLVPVGEFPAMTLWSPTDDGVPLPGGGGYAVFFHHSRRAVVADGTGAVAVWDLDKVGHPSRVGTIPSPFSIFAFGGSVSPRGDKTAGVLLEPDRVQIRELGSDEVYAEVPLPANFANTVAFTADGRTLLIGDGQNDRTLLYDVDRRQVRGQIDGHLVVTSDDRRLAATYSNARGQIMVFDPATSRELFRTSTGAFGSPGSNSALSNDGRLYVEQGIVFDLSAGALVTFLPTGGSRGTYAFSPSGDRLYITTDSGGFTNLSVVDTSTWQLVGGHRSQARDLQTFAGPVVEVSRDGSMLIVGGELLDAERLTLLGTPSESLPTTDYQGDTVFTSDGRLLVSVGTSVYSFVVDPDALADRACQLAGRNLTTAELQAFGAVGAPRCRQWP